ncbi:gliding motility-associated C-terminal domain-containing protein [Fluviicola taffensis]|uniref:PKD domain containing protein n=1 Tax=Fluviicola taffensis (strain DSM 16823 / NCIMB 13979 / RW262) TaxID=755732 RepID=F2I9B2_FLUTR|nr:gliding motility-associated C-terminal domain-containing protein [Fluviicola taffensis]AEA44069.1 PKD domain containing protein [Fluviicola taffensis DSM 16823]
MKLLTSTLLLAILFPFFSIGQILVSNGAMLSISSGALVQINGGAELTQSTTLTNNGSVTITKNSSFPIPGTFNIGNNSVVSGNGFYLIEQDWINNGAFNAGTSTVTLFGNTQQFITSTNSVSTVFNNLILTGSGIGNNRKKTLQGVNASTGPSGLLQINSSELETQTNTFFVTNSSISAITYNNTFGSEGFVSSLLPGTLSRITNFASPYIFPTGSSVGTTRFRPVELTPQSNQGAEYTVRFNNFDSNTQSFDRSQTDGDECTLNPTYFHSIDRLIGTAATDVKVFYVLAADGDWSGIAHWRNASANWNDMGTTAATISGGFTTRTRTGWNFVNPGHPYILSTLRPDAPVLNCPTFCENSENNVFTLTGSTGNYQWTFPSSGTIVSGQGTNSVTADWATGSGEVSAIAIGQNGCNSLPGTCIPTIHLSPVVQFTYTEDGFNYAFEDQTANATTWDWSFGDGNSSTIENPSHLYDGGDSYNVTLLVTDLNGCTGSGSQTVEIFQDIVVPNIITPNNDGTNDIFLIKTAGIKTFNLIIVNRWGNTMFVSNDPAVIWDGKTDGKLVDEGVYFYKLKAGSASKEYNYQGNVTVIRN